MKLEITYVTKSHHNWFDDSYIIRYLCGGQEIRFNTYINNLTVHKR